ncbi:hypothetical protein [Streptomyces sp. NPDC000878]
METVLTVIVTIAMIGVGVLLIHRLNAQHDDRIASFPYGRSGTPATGPAPSPPRKAREWLRRHTHRRTG